LLAVVCWDNPRDNIVIGDGTTRRFGPGDAVLFEDLTGQGHTSWSVGGDRLTVIVPLAD
jgi:hypothetical protein